mmetsp:Transcript_44804/g.97419  ORF Transcript_44804/g.97419 Transcript_44804/m.97419 type:complete len:240 (-) Transcript_44804:236-955(-)
MPPGQIIHENSLAGGDPTGHQIFLNPGGLLRGLLHHDQALERETVVLQPLQGGLESIRERSSSEDCNEVTGGREFHQSFPSIRKWLVLKNLPGIKSHDWIERRPWVTRQSSSAQAWSSVRQGVVHIHVQDALASVKTRLDDSVGYGNVLGQPPTLECLGLLEMGVGMSLVLRGRRGIGVEHGRDLEHHGSPGEIIIWKGNIHSTRQDASPPSKIPHKRGHFPQRNIKIQPGITKHSGSG